MTNFMFLVDIFYKQVGALLKFVLHIFAIQYTKLDGKWHIYIALENVPIKYYVDVFVLLMGRTILHRPACI